ncbi:hypothetical protein JFN87_31475, partial [Streptomyces bomunensis]|nr:hypothetical protein [Streptomyces montanisoli]
MTDTNGVPGEGRPEDAGMAGQPGVPAAGEYAYLGPSEAHAEEDDLLLMPSAQGAWSDPQPVPPQDVQPGAAPVAHDGYAQQPVAPAPAAVDVPQEAHPHPDPVPPIERPAPVTEPAPGAEAQQAPDQYASHQQVPAHAAPYAEPGTAQPQQQTYSSDGRGFSHAQAPGQAPEFQRVAPAEPVARDVPPQAPSPDDAGRGHVPSPATPPDGSIGGPAPERPQAPSRRPLHLGPPVSDPTSGVVRSLADRGPAARTTPAYPVRTQTPGPPTTGPEYLDVTPETLEEAPSAQQTGSGQAPDAAEAPQGGVPWVPQPQVPEQEPQEQQEQQQEEHTIPEATEPAQAVPAQAPAP